ncbi:hypothetical protein EM4838_13630 [Enterococcus mundtii]|nr:hypothetical protein EM4838_13630 [Enterococcus mundtii]
MLSQLQKNDRKTLVRVSVNPRSFTHSFHVFSSFAGDVPLKSISTAGREVASLKDRSLAKAKSVGWKTDDNNITTINNENHFFFPFSENKFLL